MSDGDSIEDLLPDPNEEYLRITKLRQTAEAVYGREEIERVTEEYRQIREELQGPPRPTGERKEHLLRQSACLDLQYGYEVLAGAGRVTRGDHPRHDWSVKPSDSAPPS